MKRKTLLIMLLMALFTPLAMNAQQSLPYEYGFENNNLATDGWISSGSNGVISTAAAKTGTYGFRFEYSTSDVYLMSPILSGGTNGVDVSFYYKAYSNSYLDHFNVGYTTDENMTDPSRFTYGSLVTSSTSWQEYTASLPAGTVRVAIKYDSDNYNDGWYLYLDDFTFEAISSCAKPTDLAIDYREGATTATVTWRGDARSYNVDVNGTIEVVNGNSYTIRDLAPATAYTVKVQADCGDEQSGWVNAGSFTTPCPETFAIPYAYGFEDAAGINCWTLSPSNNISLDDQDSEFAHSGNAFLFLNYTTTPPQYVISPELSGIVNGLHVEFWYSQYENGVETFQVGYSTTDNDPGSFTWGDEITASTTYQRFSANYPAETKYVAVMHTANDQYYLFLDDFLFEESASCLEPTGVQVADVTTTGATLSWNAGGEESAWDIFVTDDATILPNDATTPTVANIADNPYALTGLTSGTTYYVYVRAICGENEVSAWSSTAIFNTECDAMALPYTYDFEDATLPVCWNTIVENTSYTGINVMTAITQVLAFYMGTYQNPALVAVLPEVDAAYPLNGYQITFDACYASSSSSNMTSGKLAIGIMTDPTDVTTFELIEEVAITDDLSAFGSHTVMLNSYTGDGQYIAIKDIYTQTGYVLVDNIEVTELPSCLAPTALTASLTATSAELSWTANSSETAWTLYWKESGANVYTEVANATNPYTLEGLTATTAYEYYVVANCSETDQSEASEVYSFNTLCGSISTFPWTETFNNLTVAGSIPNCWDNAEGTTTINSYKWCYNTKTSGNGMASNGHEGSCVVFDSYNNSNNNTNFLKTVPISLPSDQPMQLSFWYKNPTGGDFSVYISTDGGATHETALATGLTGVSAWTEHNPINLGNYAGQDVVIVFKGTSNYGSGDAYIYLDDVTVNAVPSCAIPTALAATTTNNSAELSWTANSGEDTWTVYYREVTPDKVRANEYVEVIVGENPYTLEDLNDATAYEFYVIANCSEEDNSEPSAVFTFTTKCNPITDFPWSEDFEDFQTSTYGVTLNEPCWENEHLEGNGSYFFEVISITNGDNSTNQLRLHDMSSGNLTKLMLPGMNLPNANFQFSIDVYRSSSYSTYTTEGIRVFASADGEIEGATELAFIPRVYSASSDVIPAENAAGWYTYNLPIGMSGTCYIIIRGESKFGTATYMDNFAVSEPSFTTTIIGYTQNENPKGGYYLIASPIGNVNPDKVDNMLANEYDLYYFDQTHNKLEWVNYETTSDGFDLLAGKGYLYANSETVDLVFHGSANTDVDEAILTLESGVDFEGWNLVGNPFGDTAYIDREFYVMNGSGSEIAVAEVNYIEPMQGVFVIAKQDQETLKFTTTAPANQGKKLVFNISQGRGGVIDRAIIRFDEGQELPKFQLFDNSTKLAIEQNSKEFAVVHSRAAGEMPMNFKAETDGNYTLTVSETLNTQLSTLNLIDHLTGNVIDLLENPSYSFNATTTDDPARFTVVFRKVNNDPEVTQNVSVNAGWNWWSTYMEMIGVDGVQLLENALGDNGIQIKSQMAFASNSTSGWQGSLGSIKNESMYMINVEHADDYAVTGNVAYPTDHTIRLTEGWNWVGYVQNNIMELNEALVNMPASDEDIIKSLNGFAIYYEDYGWWGELQNLQPGQGYMIRSNTSSTFTYPDNAKSSVDNMPMNVEKYWNNAIGKYAHNMNLMAVIEMNGNELRTENAELAAFDNNDECRGSAKLMYVKPIDRYVAFLTVQGNNNEPIHFMVRNQDQNYKVNETVTMIVDEVIGTAHNPFRMTLKGAGISENSTALSIFPNPTTKGQQVRIELPVTMDNATIEIIDVLGRVVYENIAGGDDVHTVSTPDVPGVYTVRVTDAQGQTFHGRLTVK